MHSIELEISNLKDIAYDKTAHARVPPNFLRSLRMISSWSVSKMVSVGVCIDGSFSESSSARTNRSAASGVVMWTFAKMLDVAIKNLRIWSFPYYNTEAINVKVETAREDRKNAA